MKLTSNRLLIVLVSVLLSACATHPVSETSDGCVGTVMTPPAGLIETTDNALLTSAIDVPGKGKLCKGKVFVAEKEVTVYRVWDASKSYTLYGGWWSFSRPTGPRNQYQVVNDICPEWSALDKMSTCKIKVGAHIAVGPGQSAQCSNELLPASAVNQVYIPNDSRNNVLYVENCDAGMEWPGSVN